MTYDNAWTYNNVEIDEPHILDNVGFVYLITNKQSNKKYIGKKLFFFSRIKRVKGKRKRLKEMSDWKTYYGSNKELQKDVEELGAENFTREILYMCKTKGECSYYEAKEQFARDVLIREDYYNGVIQCRINYKHLPKSR